MNPYLHKLSSEQLRELKNSSELENLSGDFEIKSHEAAESGKVPILVEGEIIIMKNNEDFLVVTPGYILGLNPFLNGRKFRLKCRAKNAKAFFARIDDLVKAKAERFMSRVVPDSI